MPVYGVADIHLDENAATGTAAREKAIAAATAQAYQVILRRILLPGQPGEADMRALNGADFVDFIHIDNENALAQRYIADIDICFDAARIRSALMEKNLQWSELVTAPIYYCQSGKTRQGCGSGRKMSYGWIAGAGWNARETVWCKPPLLPLILFWNAS